MHSEITQWGVRSTIWYSNKLLRLSLSGLHVNQKSVQKVKNLICEKNCVVLLPFYKSYADFFIMNYVLHHYGIDTPFTFGNLEDSPRISITDKWMIKAGYVRSVRKHDQNLQSSYVNSALLKKCLSTVA